MKFLYTLVLAILTLISAHARAEIDLRIGEGVNLHAINGKIHKDQGFFSGKPRLVLKNGVHQLVVDYQAEIGRNRDDSVIDNSDVFVILFEARDEALTLSAPEISTRRELKEFNDNPDWVLLDDDRDPHDFHVDVLKKSGFQLVRDYEDEISEFNKTQSKAALKKANSAVTESNPAAESLPPGQSADNQEIVRQMLRYWYSRADENTRSEMKHWINSGE